MPTRAMAAVLVFVVAACGGSSTISDPTPSATPGILQPGVTAETPCEKALVAMDAHAGFDDEFGRLEDVVFRTCTFAEFKAFNDKVTAYYRYPDATRHVSRSCIRASSGYGDTKLCQTFK